MPLLFLGQARIVAAQTAPIINQLPATASDPAVPFVYNSPDSSSLSGSLMNATLSTAVSVNNHLTSGYGFVANIFTTPTLPEGFAMAKVPTFRDRTSTAFASSVSSVSSFVASLLFVSPKNSASSAAVKNNKAETTEVETTETGTATIETEANEAETNSESAVEPVAAPATLLYAQGTTRFDFDGDGKADASRWQSSTGDWKVRNSSSGSFSTVSLGTATVAAPADYDGDGKTDHATFTDWSGTWKIRKSSTNQTETIVYGGSGDRVVSGDYDGDGIADIAIYRPSNGTWYVRKSTNLQTVSSAFGASTDVPVPGNYDGDGKMDYAVFRPSNGTWYVLYSSTGTSGYFSWGAGSDTPVPADYDGDNKTDFAVYRPSSGTWYAYSSLANNGSYISKIWGNYGDQPVPANYDGDGKDDFAVWRPKTGVWHIVKSSDPNLNTYEYHQVGVSGDVAVPSAYLKQIGSLVVPYHLANARLAPKNATGGTNLYSQNFGWGKTLVSLPGRAGLDAGFGISYNSLVWTKEPASNTMVFDADSANVSPGFRFGFPTIEPSYYNALTQKFSYMMVTPSGGRVEFRQDAASGLYETADSTYAQLKVNAPLMSGGGHQQTSSTETVTLTVTTTDGTMMDYSWKAGAYRLNQIKDRNGNFITIVYDDQYGLLQSVTDTLGRVINVNYDAEFYPTTITQQWKSGNGDGSLVPRTYAAFSYGYTPVNPTFDPNANLTVYGPSGNTNVKVLTQITYLDGTSTTFNYNSFGQVHKVRNVAADSSAHVLNSIRTNLETPGAAEPDCPRFTKTYNFIENFNGGAETLIHNTLTAGGTLSAGGEYIGPADVVEVRMEPTQAPHDVRSKTYYYGTGNWAEGLPFGTEDVVSGVQKRWTRTFWTQDDTSKNYKINPRVTESKVGDASNTKRTTVDYHLKSGSTTASLFGLVREVKVYDTNLTTVLKRAVTDYNLNAAYLSRRIIGLPGEQRLYDRTNALMSKIVYTFDTDANGTPKALQNNPAIRHDSANYGTSFIVGRGNLTATTRCDAALSTDTVCGGGTLSENEFNVAGAIVKQSTPGTAGITRVVNIGYADVFNDTTTSRNTYAYPTTITDPAGSSSQVKYRFDIGANVWAKSPDPKSGVAGKQTARDYDDKGRLVKEAVIGYGGAYTRYEYPSNNTRLKVYSTITDAPNSTGGADAADEVLTETLTDGAGRVTWSRTAHPGSNGGWSATNTEYDVLGQIKRSSAPTEVNASWQLAGDGQTRGWLWKSQEYDWKGRVTKVTNTDGTFVESAYDGCGCAGGEIVTVTGEQLADGRRKQKIYSDILGRQYKSEVLNWDGSVYSTTLTDYNGRDQANWVKQFVGATPANGTVGDACPAQPTGTEQSCQITKMGYDGHGRLKTRHAPQQDADKATVYDYYPTDEVQQVTDARGATTAYSYNNRGLVTAINYSMPQGQSNPDPALPSLNSTTGFDYDALGNRLWMTDSLGRTDYDYDGLSRLKSETRQFTDTIAGGNPLVMANAPLANNSFKLTYTYGLGGQLTALTDPYEATINYDYDPAGRLKKVGGTPFGNVSTYADGAKYQAWGGLKELTYGSGLQMTMTHNNRLQAASYNLAGGGSGQLMNKIYNYYADGSLSLTQDTLNSKFNRLNIYDHAGRIKYGKSGAEAQGGGTVAPADQQNNLPYRQEYGFNAFGNLTKRDNRHWGIESYYGQSNNLNYTYHNNRIQGTGWSYDADGRNLQTALPDDYATSTYNAAGQMVRSLSSQTDAVRFYDGNGREIKRKTANYVETSNSSSWVSKPVKYYVRSSILGNEVVSEVWANGKKGKTFVRAAGSQIAYQSAYYSDTSTLHEAVIFEYMDASGMSHRATDRYGSPVATGDGGDGSPVETDPLGNNVGTSSPYVQLITYNPNTEYPMLQPYFDDSPQYINGQRVTATLDGMAIGLGQAMSMLASGSAVPSNIAQYNNTTSGLGIGGTFVEVPSTNGGGNACSNGQCPNGNVVTVNAPQSTFIFVPSYSVVSWNPRQAQQPPSELGGGGGGDKGPLNKGKKAVYDPQKLRNCLKERGVTVKEIDFQRDTGGFFSGTFNNFFEGEQQLETSTNVHSKDSKSLAQAYNNTLVQGQTRYITQSGFTFYERPKNNWIASDVASNTKLYTDIGVLALYIHELGNSIGVQVLGKSAINSFGKDGLNNNDRDIGTNIEDCVFGGIVGLRSGRRGSNREF